MSKLFERVIITSPMERELERDVHFLGQQKGRVIMHEKMEGQRLGKFLPSSRRKTRKK